MATWVHEKIELLVRTVARAFYTDQDCTVIDALLRQEFVPDNDLGHLLNMKENQVRSILQNLKEEQIVLLEENVQDIQLERRNYWYIDYRYFVDVVTYRLYKMDSLIQKDEEAQNHGANIYYQCPMCDKVCSFSEANRDLGSLLCPKCDGEIRGSCKVENNCCTITFPDNEMLCTKMRNGDNLLLSGQSYAVMSVNRLGAVQRNVSRQQFTCAVKIQPPYQGSSGDLLDLCKLASGFDRSSLPHVKLRELSSEMQVTETQTLKRLMKEQTYKAHRAGNVDQLFHEGIREILKELPKSKDIPDNRPSEKIGRGIGGHGLVEMGGFGTKANERYWKVMQRGMKDDANKPGTSAPVRRRNGQEQEVVIQLEDEVASALTNHDSEEGARFNHPSVLYTDVQSFALMDIQDPLCGTALQKFRQQRKNKKRKREDFVVSKNPGTDKSEAQNGETELYFAHEIEDEKEDPTLKDAKNCIIPPGGYPEFLVTKFEVDHEDGGESLVDLVDSRVTEDNGNVEIVGRGLGAYGGLDNLELFFEGPFQLKKETPVIMQESSISSKSNMIASLDDAEAHWDSVRKSFQTECERQFALSVGVSNMQEDPKMEKQPSATFSTIGEGTKSGQGGWNGAKVECRKMVGFLDCKCAHCLKTARVKMKVEGRAPKREVVVKAEGARQHQNFSTSADTKMDVKPDIKLGETGGRPILVEDHEVVDLTSEVIAPVKLGVDFGFSCLVKQHPGISTEEEISNFMNDQGLEWEWASNVKQDPEAMVYVNLKGVDVPLKDISVEDEHTMTKEEFVTYYTSCVETYFVDPRCINA